MYMESEHSANRDVCLAQIADSEINSTQRKMDSMFLC